MLPASFPASLTHFLTTSCIYQTGLIRSARALLQEIVIKQEKHLSSKVEQAARLPNRGQASKRSRTRAREADEKSTRKNVDGPPNAPDPSKNPGERAALYLVQLRQDRQEREGGDSSGRNRQLIRSLDEAVGHLGRGRWDEQRKGRGRMANRKIMVR